MLIRRLCPACAAGHPLWLCGFRPFFVLTAVAAPLLISLWLAFLALGLPLPAVVGGPFIWHAHELIFGFGLAAVAGFALTSIPEFTASSAIDRPTVRLLTGLWLLGRLAFWTSGLLGNIALAVSGLAHLALLGLLAACLAPRLWRDPNRRHLSFLWAFGGLALGVAGFYIAALRGQPPGPWLHATLGVLMMLIVVAMSRISMRIVNNAIDETTAMAKRRPSTTAPDRPAATWRSSASGSIRSPNYCCRAAGSAAGWRWPRPPRCSICSTTGTSAAPCCAAGR
jgi:uncharacterized protein involved in response to NO